MLYLILRKFTLQLFSHLKRLVEKNLSPRRCLIGTSFLLVGCLYLALVQIYNVPPSTVLQSHSKKNCFHTFDTYHHIESQSLNISSVHYTANGYVGVHLDEGIYVREGRVLGLRIPADFVRLSLPVMFQQDFLLPNEAKLVTFMCFPNEFRMIRTIYAHASRPNLIVVKYTLINSLSNVGAKFLIPGIDFSRWYNSTMSVKSVRINNNSHNYQHVFGLLNVSAASDYKRHGVPYSDILRDTTAHTALSVLTSLHTSPISIPAGTNRTVDHVIFIKYSTVHGRETSQLRQRHASQLLQEFRSHIREPHALHSQHDTEMRRLSGSGFTISHSLVPDIINNEHIDSVMFHVTRHVAGVVAAVMHVHANTSLRDEEEAHSSTVSNLDLVDGCYDDKQPSIEAKALWLSMDTMQHMLRIVNLWLLLLEKKGCHRLLGKGPLGVSQALILSMGALKFSNQHLELSLQPKHMYRDYFFRNVMFADNVFLNISVFVNKDTFYAFIGVSVLAKSSQSHYFACEGGCLDPGIELSSHVTVFQVKQTDPPTPCLYITTDLMHLRELKHTIHVREVIRAPSVDSQLMLLHRHGHKLGGIPLIYYIVLGILVLLFHACLLRLALQESRFSNIVRRARHL